MANAVCPLGAKTRWSRNAATDLSATGCLRILTGPVRSSLSKDQYRVIEKTHELGIENPEQIAKAWTNHSTCLSYGFPKHKQSGWSLHVATYPNLTITNWDLISYPTTHDLFLSSLLLSVAAAVLVSSNCMGSPGSLLANVTPAASSLVDVSIFC